MRIPFDGVGDVRGKRQERGERGGGSERWIDYNVTVASLSVRPSLPLLCAENIDVVLYPDPVQSVPEMILYVPT